MTALAIEIARMIYAVPDISPFTSTTRDELSTLYPLLRSLKLIISKECNENVMNISNNFPTAKGNGIVFEIMTASEKTEVSKQEMISEIAKLIFYLTCDSSKVQGKMVI